uniref:Uncharacterized protein n=1 Tax=Ciona intestinalis TaxID=7719 RepID=H2XKZ4_CIOIN
STRQLQHNQRKIVVVVRTRRRLLGHIKSHRNLITHDKKSEVGHVIAQTLGVAGGSRCLATIEHPILRFHVPITTTIYTFRLRVSLY